MTSWWADRGPGLRIGGHRGEPSRAPENTLAGFTSALAAGADYLELDVHLSRDGELVVIHDEALERTTDGTGRVADITAAELRALDAGRWFGPGFAGERIPTLEEVLALLGCAAGRHPAAVVEAKGEGTGRPLARMLDGSPLRDRLAICSFEPDELRAARRAAPAIPTMFIVDRDRPDDDPLAAAAACGATLVNVPAAWLTRADVARLHGAGLLVAGGTGDDEATIRHAVRIGLDAIDSNVPREALAWRDAALVASGGAGEVST